MPTSRENQMFFAGETCSGCRWCMDVGEPDVKPEDRVYECHRFPPQCVAVADVGGETSTVEPYFPQVALHDWCGEWKESEPDAD